MPLPSSAMPGAFPTSSPHPTPPSTTLKHPLLALAHSLQTPPPPLPSLRSTTQTPTDIIDDPYFEPITRTLTQLPTTIEQAPINNAYLETKGLNDGYFAPIERPTEPRSRKMNVEPGLFEAINGRGKFRKLDLERIRQQSIELQSVRLYRGRAESVALERYVDRGQAGRDGGGERGDEGGDADFYQPGDSGRASEGSADRYFEPMRADSGSVERERAPMAAGAEHSFTPRGDIAYFAPGATNDHQTEVTHGMSAFPRLFIPSLVNGEDQFSTSLDDTSTSGPTTRQGTAEPYMSTDYFSPIPTRQNTMSPAPEAEYTYADRIVDRNTTPLVNPYFNGYQFRASNNLPENYFNAIQSRESSAEPSSQHGYYAPLKNPRDRQPTPSNDTRASAYPESDDEEVRRVSAATVGRSSHKSKSASSSEVQSPIKSPPGINPAAPEFVPIRSVQSVREVGYFQHPLGTASHHPGAETSYFEPIRPDARGIIAAYEHHLPKPNDTTGRDQNFIPDAAVWGHNYVEEYWGIENRNGLTGYAADLERWMDMGDDEFCVYEGKGTVGRVDARKMKGGGRWGQDGGVRL